MMQSSPFLSLTVLSLCLIVEGRSFDPKSIAFDCPAPEGFFAYPGLCVGDFITCVDGVAYPQNCPGDTVFDPQEGHCIKYEQASCRETPFECPNNEPGYYPLKPGQCSANFWACVGGTPVPVKCPEEDQVFDEQKGTCVPAASCKGSFTCPASDGFYARPGECSAQYWSCIGGVAYPRECGGTDNVFDPVLKVCVRLSQASCRDAFQCPEPNGRFPITENECRNDFWICVSGEAYPETCPGTSIFDPFRKVCVAATSNPCV